MSYGNWNWKKNFFGYKKFVIDNSSCKEMLIKDKYFWFIDIYLLINSEIFRIDVGNNCY